MDFYLQALTPTSIFSALALDMNKLGITFS